MTEWSSMETVSEDAAIACQIPKARRPAKKIQVRPVFGRSACTLSGCLMKLTVPMKAITRRTMNPTKYIPGDCRCVCEYATIARRSAGLHLGADDSSGGFENQRDRRRPRSIGVAAKVTAYAGGSRTRRS